MSSSPVYLLDAVHGILGQDLEKCVGAQLTLQNAELLVDSVLNHELAQLAPELCHKTMQKAVDINDVNYFP